MALPGLGATIYRIGDSTASLAVKLRERLPDHRRISQALTMLRRRHIWLVAGAAPVTSHALSLSAQPNAWALIPPAEVLR